MGSIRLTTKDPLSEGTIPRRGFAPAGRNCQKTLPTAHRSSEHQHFRELPVSALTRINTGPAGRFTESQRLTARQDIHIHTRIQNVRLLRIWGLHAGASYAGQAVAACSADAGGLSERADAGILSPDGIHRITETGRSLLFIVRARAERRAFSREQTLL